MQKIIYTTADVTVDADYPTRNFGKSEQMSIYYDDMYTLMYFELPADLSTFDISSVRLNFLIAWTENARRLDFHKILGKWIEGNGTHSTAEYDTSGSVSWNTKPPFDSSYKQLYISSTPATTWHSVDVTDDILFRPHYGWLIKQHSAGGGTTLWSREHGTPAYLTITYTLRTPVMELSSEYVNNLIHISWKKQPINNYAPSTYYLYRYDPLVNMYKPIATLNGSTFEYDDYDILDTDFDYKYCIDGLYTKEGVVYKTVPVFTDNIRVYKSNDAQIEIAAIGGIKSMRHVLNTTHSEYNDRGNTVSIGLWKKGLDATSIPTDEDIILRGDGVVQVKNIEPLTDDVVGSDDDRWLEIHANELNTESSETAKLRLWNGR